MSILIRTVQSLTEEEGVALAAPLLAFNSSVHPHQEPQVVALVLEADGTRMEGGLWGEIFYDWLRIDIVAVPASFRGQGVGSSLMAQAEAIARQAGCEGIWLDTFSFQAKAFYEKLGFVVAGEIPDHPRGARRYFMRKQFCDATAPVAGHGPPEHPGSN